MSDLISRQAAIDEIKALYEWHEIVTEDRAIDHFKRLPSAQPEIIRCKDCKFYYPNMEADGETGDCKKAQWFRRLQYPNDFCSRAEREEE